MTWRRDHPRTIRRRSKSPSITWSESAKRSFVRDHLPPDEFNINLADNIRQRIGGAGHTVERLVWDYEPGKPLPMNNYDDITGFGGDKGYYGIHFGDVEGWLPILVSDYDRSFENAMVVEIDTDGMVLLPDPNIMTDKYETWSGSLITVPDSGVLVWKRKTIPASKIVRAYKPDSKWMSFDDELAMRGGYP